MNEASLFALLAAFIGAVHMLSPDHWLPASIVVWQKGWRLRRAFAFVSVVLALHVLMGLSIYFAFSRFFADLDPDRSFGFALILLVCGTVVRVTRFSRIQEVIRSGAQSRWGMFAVVSLLGPSESVIPVLLKGKAIGIGYLVPWLAFWGGSWVAGFGLVMVGRVLWNRPFLLPRGMYWARHQGVVIPMVALVALGLRALLKI